jgi:hypothetical protein
MANLRVINPEARAPACFEGVAFTELVLEGRNVPAVRGL